MKTYKKLLASSTIILVGVTSAWAQTNATVPSCSEHETKIVECIAHPEYRGEEVEKCGEVERAYRECADMRRTQVAGEPGPTRELVKNEVVFIEAKVKAYKAAKKVCAAKKDACSSERLRVIKKMIESLPKEAKKLKKMFS